VQLLVPNEVISLSNASEVFKPFDAGLALGDTTPTQPLPPRHLTGKHPTIHTHYPLEVGWEDIKGWKRFSFDD
jgi:hypothetical protein